MIFVIIYIVVQLYFFLLYLLGRNSGFFDNGDGDKESWIAEDVRSALNTEVDPCSDFYEFSCGGWIEKTKLKPSQSRFTRSFNGIHERNEEIVLSIIKNSPESSLVKKLYDSCMDTSTLDSLGIDPIKDLMEEVDVTVDSISFSDKKIAELVSLLHGFSFSPLFQIIPAADPGNPRNLIAWIRSTSLPLPQSFYENNEKIKKYGDHIDAMFELIEGKSSKNKIHGQNVVKLETYFASKAPTPTQLRNPFKYYHPKTLLELKSLAPDFDWETFCNKSGIDTALGFTLDSPEYVSNVTYYFKHVASKVQMKSYLKWTIIKNTASFLTKKIRDKQFEFFGTYLYGVKEQKERELQCVSGVGSIDALGFLVGKQFVKEKFSESYKNKVLVMLGNIKIAFKGILNSIGWMEKATKNEALLKLERITDMIGYPDDGKWPEFGIEVENFMDSKKWANNRLMLWNYLRKKETDKIGGYTDKKQWEMTPQTVNAYYEPTLNGMCFPAGILQYPFFHEKFPESMLYGGIGAVIGHELSHAFDDEGSQYDSIGKLRHWWSTETRLKFEAKANCIRTQYSKYSPLDGYFINGNLTSGENIADNAGVKDSFLALQSSIGKNLMEEKSSLLEEYTNEQLFFISFAQIWCTKQTDEIIIQRVLTDPHSAPKFRVIGTFSNSPEFAKAFKCKLGDEMNPAKKCDLF